MAKHRKKKNNSFNLMITLMFILIVGAASFFYYHNRPDDSAASQNAVKKNTPAVEKKTGITQKKNPQPAKPAVGQKAAAGKESLDGKVNDIIKKMSLEEKVGQLMMVGFYGTEEDNNIKYLISNKKIGGVILFDRNMQTPGQVAQLTNQLKSEASRNNFSLPLLIGADQEGGPVLRMRSQVSPIPSEQDLGMHATPEEVYNIAKINGQEMAAMGLNLDFSPVLDLSGQDERSFGSNPVKSTNFDAKEIEGLNASNVTATLKHFPGNGRVVVDPHLDTSLVRADRNTLENVDMVPFKQMIQRQNTNQFFVMVTHVKYPAFDQNMPASISKPIIQGLLRDQLGYNGIVITDDLDMGAISKYYSYEDLGYTALNAGADILLICHQYDHQLELYNGIIKAVQSGKLSEERIDESVRRVLTYKLRYLSNQSVSAVNANQVVRSSQHLSLIENYQKNKQGKPSNQ